MPGVGPRTSRYTPSEILAYKSSPTAWPLDNAMKWIHAHVFTSRKISAEGADFNVERRQTKTGPARLRALEDQLLVVAEVSRYFGDI